MPHWKHNLDPTLLSLGDKIQIRWYGMMYLVGFVSGYFFLKNRWKRGLFALNPEETQFLITNLMIGMMIGARAAYAFIYHEYRHEIYAQSFEFLMFWKGIDFLGVALGAAFVLLFPSVIIPVLFKDNGKINFDYKAWKKITWPLLVLGAIYGGRLAHVWNMDEQFQYFFEIPKIWNGGLSFHGALIGFCGGIVYTGRRLGVKFFHIADTVVMGAALGVIFGRIGNFINGELWGRVTDVPWGIVFPMAGPDPRHPSQLYQAFGEGLAVLVLLLLIEKWLQKKGLAPEPVKLLAKGKKKAKPVIVKWTHVGLISPIYLMLYGIARFVIEFFRQPDEQLGFYFGFLSMGQILCAIMFAIGLGLLVMNLKRPIEEEYKVTPQA